MLKVAVCDDDSYEVNRVKDFIIEYGAENSIKFNIFKYYDGEALLNANESFDLIFLDIEMRVLGGLETAQKIRETNMNVPIVYVTEFPDYSIRAHKVHAFGYICKTMDREKMKNELFFVLQDFLISRKEAEEIHIDFITTDGAVIENVNNICCFLVEGRQNVRTITVYDEYFIKDTLSNIYERLDKEQFYLTSKNSIVNLKYVRRMEKDNGIVMKDGSWVPLAQKKQKDFYMRLSKQLRKKIL